MIPVPPPQGQPIPQGEPKQQQVTIDAVMSLLRDGMQRRFRIDIETDSTVTGDESQERADRTQFIEATTKFIEAWGPIVQANPTMTQLAGELLLFGTRSFRVGRSLEEVIEETVDKLEAQAAQPKPPPEPSPDEKVKFETAKVKGAVEIKKAETEAAANAQDAQAKQVATHMDMVGKVMDHEHQKVEHAMDMEKLHVETALEAKSLDQKSEAADHQHDLRITEMDRKAKEAKSKPEGEK